MVLVFFVQNPYLLCHTKILNIKGGNNDKNRNY